MYRINEIKPEKSGALLSSTYDIPVHCNSGITVVSVSWARGLGFKDVRCQRKSIQTFF